MSMPCGTSPTTTHDILRTAAATGILPNAGAWRGADGGAGMSDILLKGQGITRRWGGLVAVNDVALELKRGEVHAVIGTNGAGKSTLINILSGEIPPSAGTVQLLGQDVTAWSQPRRARATKNRRRRALTSAAAGAAAQLRPMASSERCSAVRAAGSARFATHSGVLSNSSNCSMR